MENKVLSIFVDESGDFGQYNPSSPYYYVAIVLHNQAIDISKSINMLETQVSNWGYPEHAIHTGPLIRRESFYKNDLRENRKALFNALYHFTRMVDIKYICPRINQGECTEKSILVYTEKFRKIETNQYKLSQVADLICTVEAIAHKVVLTKSEAEFFHSKSEFKKNIYKNIVRKKL